MITFKLPSFCLETKTTRFSKLQVQVLMSLTIEKSSNHRVVLRLVIPKRLQILWGLQRSCQVLAITKQILVR
jgi:hypothetical protein